MRIALLTYLFGVFLIISCGQSKKPLVKSKEIQPLKNDSISIVVLEDNNSLRDSSKFYNLVREIISNMEIHGGKEIPNSIICNKIYNMVYQTPDSIIPLSRKMDMIQMLAHFYRRTSDFYIESFVPSKIRENSKVVKARPFLLLPFIFSNPNEMSPSVLKIIMEQDSIIVPKDYLHYSSEVHNWLNTLPKNDINKALQIIRTRHVKNPNIRVVFSDAFREKYSKVPGWTIL